MTDLHRFNNMTPAETAEYLKLNPETKVWTVFRNERPYQLFEGTASEAEFELSEWYHQAYLDSGGYPEDMDKYTISEGDQMPAMVPVENSVAFEYSEIPF